MPRYHVDRSANIDAPAERVFDTVADFSTWPSWSPWLCSEPDAEVNVSADPSSVGSLYSWKGEIVGQGEIEHRSLERGRRIDDEIRFIKPFKSQSAVSFELQPAGAGTRITWNMDGRLPWFMFWMKPMMQTFIGMDFDRGLKMLKEWIETGKVLSQTTIRGVKSVGPLQMAGVRKQCRLSEIGPSMEAAFGEATQKFAQHNLSAGEPMSVYHKFDMKTLTFDYTGGYVLADDSHSVSDELSRWSTPAGRALVVEHVGSFNHLGNAWSAANQYARSKKLKLGKLAGFEIYKCNWKQTPPEEQRAEIYLPLH